MRLGGIRFSVPPGPALLSWTPVGPARSMGEQNRLDFPIGGPADVDGPAVRCGECQPVGTDPPPDAVSLPLDAALLRQLPIVIEERLNFSFAERFHPFGFWLHGRRLIVVFLLSRRASSSSAFSAASISSRNRERAALKLKVSPPRVQTR